MKISNELLRGYLISRRSFMLLAGKLSMLSLLSLRMLYMQMVDGPRYKTLSDKNRISVVMMPPRRGKILDIDGKVIAENTSAFRVLLDKTENPNYVKPVELLCDILELPAEEKMAVLKVASKIHKKIPSPLLGNISWQQVSVIEENISQLPGIFVDIGQYRIYPHGNDLAHPIGYISSITQQDKRDVELSNIGDFAIGKGGVEKFYEQQLRGEFGIKEAEINAKGIIVREISSEASKPGSDISLNIDLDIQLTTMRILPKKGSSAVVMDLESGRILTLASAPGFDPNKFTKKISHDYWQDVLKDPYKPLINKSVQNNYPPGSIFKIVVVLAALESGMDPEEKINCTGAPALGDFYYKCSRAGGHGHINLSDAIKQSCNTYMFYIAKAIGTNKIFEIARKFGFGNLTGIDLPVESAGLLPDGDWKMKRFNQEWRLGDSLNISIGQGFVLSTPLQMTRFCAALASSGTLFTPRILGAAGGEQIDVNPKHLQFVKDAMFDVINGRGGTASAARITKSGWELAGKTGTSQVRSKTTANIDLSAASVPWGSRNHALFTCFGPFTKPRFATTVVVDHGGSGSTACAGIAKEIMLKLFNKYL